MTPDTMLKVPSYLKGLVETLGDMSLAADFLRPGKGPAVAMVESKASGNELKILVKGYEEPLVVRREKEDEEAPEPMTPAQIAAHLFKGLRGSNNLVFPNSRREVERYLNAGDRAPDKVLVSKSGGNVPFRLAATKVKIGNAKRDVLHVMTNSYPASELHLDYRVRLTSVKIQETKQGELETPRQAVRRVAEEATLSGAQREILKALDAGARQVIYFAQDKLFLRRLRMALWADADHALSDKTVKVLDSSVPGFERKLLLEPETRDSVKVFLMTSSWASRRDSQPSAQMKRWMRSSRRWNEDELCWDIAWKTRTPTANSKMRHEDLTNLVVSGDRVVLHSGRQVRSESARRPSCG